MKLSVHSESYNLDIPLERRLTIIRGDSGTGKTTLVDLIRENSFDLNIESDYPVIVGDDTNYEAIIRGSFRNIIIFDDEDCVGTKKFASLYYEYAVENDLYFLLITREVLDSFDSVQQTAFKQLSYSIDSIYELVSNGPNYSLRRFYNIPDYNASLECNSVLVEDSTSGYEFFLAFFTSLFSNMEVFSATNGKSSIVEDSLTHKDEILLVIVDCASFGCHVEEFYNRIVLRQHVYIINGYECFEEFLLRTNMFKLNELVASSFFDVCNEANRYNSWEKYFEHLINDCTRNKEYRYTHSSKLRKCYLAPCNSCNQFIMSKCDYYDKTSTNKFVSLLVGTKYERLLPEWLKHENNSPVRIQI